jgi:hypothetical protein
MNQKVTTLVDMTSYNVPYYKPGPEYVKHVKFNFCVDDTPGFTAETLLEVVKKHLVEVNASPNATEATKRALVYVKSAYLMLTDGNFEAVIGQGVPEGPETETENADTTDNS